MSDKLPPLIQDWILIATDTLHQEVGLQQEQAASAGRQVVLALVNQYGGQQFYLPTCLAEKLTERDRQIYDAYDGSNRDELIRKYGISLNTFYGIIRRVSAFEGKSGDLFDGANR